RILREPNRPLAKTLADDVVHAGESTAANEQDIRGVDLDVLLLGVLPATLRRNIRRGAFEHFEQSLLHAFARNVARNRDVLARLADLIDFVDVQHATLGGLDIEISSMQQLQK